MAVGAPIAEETRQLVEMVRIAAKEGKISQSALENINRWLTEASYRDSLPVLAEHIRQGKWELLEDLFFTVIPFGTGGRRGRMYPIGTNAINDRTMGESAQGLADYVRHAVAKQELSCAIAYDTRHRSREFAVLSAEVMAGSGFKVYFLDGYRSTPELSFAIRHFGCDCGIMVTASHNPPSDNAVKVYWSDGGQLVPPHDMGVIEAVRKVAEIRRVPFEEARQRGQILLVQEEADEAFVRAVLAQSCDGPRDLRIVYSPLHGVGSSAVIPVLQRAGFTDVHVYPRHAEPNGDFPNVPNHIANPEVPEVFSEILQYADQIEADLVLATDPDCDRVGCASRENCCSGSPWRLLTGNQTGALLAAEVIRRAQQAGRSLEQCYIVKTMVTTELIGAIAQSCGVRVIGDLPVGFRWIGREIERQGPEGFLLGAEESYGYLIGTHARDKDAAVASLVICELAASLKAGAKTLFERLIELFRQYGWYRERTISIGLPGARGMEVMERLMASFREQPPGQLGEFSVSKVRDYNRLLEISAKGSSRPLAGEKNNTLFFDTDRPGNAAAVRPSGTEPKIKFYFFVCEDPKAFGNYEEAERVLEARLDSFEKTIRKEVARRTSEAN